MMMNVYRSQDWNEELCLAKLVTDVTALRRAAAVARIVGRLGFGLAKKERLRG